MVVFPALSRPTMITLCSAMKTALVSHSSLCCRDSSWVWTKLSATSAAGFLSQQCPAPGAMARCVRGPARKVCVGRCCSEQGRDWQFIPLHRNHSWEISGGCFPSLTANVTLGSSPKLLQSVSNSITPTTAALNSTRQMFTFPLSRQYRDVFAKSS